MNGPPYIVSRISPFEATCSRCHARKGLQTLGESCNNNCGGKVVEPLLSRVAVGSLELEPLADALRPRLRRTLKALEWVDMMNALLSIPRSGGSVPLPDGTRIEAEATAWPMLALEGYGGWSPGLSGALVLAAERGDHEAQHTVLAGWNAEHGR